MQISIKNFQSIEDITITLPEGAFTCLVGQSNIGKSAIRRAIECVLFNNSDASYIRNGSKYCSVEILFDAGTQIKWMRDEKSASYEINGETFSKLSKTIPQPILDLGFRELEINKEKLNVQVASQFDNIFLLNMTGSKVTDVFSNLGNLNKIINANKACTSDLKSNKGRLSLRKEDLITLKFKIKNYSGLDEQRNVFDSIKVGFEEIKKLKKKKEDLTLLAKKFDKTANLYKALGPCKQINIEDPDVDISKFIQLKKLLLKIEMLIKIVTASSELAKINEIVLDLDLVPMKNLKSLYLKYETALGVNSYYSELGNIKEIVLDTEKLYKIKPLKELLVKLEKSKTSLVSLRANIIQTEEKRQVLFEQEKEVHKEIKVCPLCDKEF